MASVKAFIRNTPALTLKAYFDAQGIALTEPVNWNGEEGEIVRPLLKAVDKMDSSTLAQVQQDTDRVAALAGEAGQAALYGASRNREELEALKNGHERALWTFLRDRVTFERAEEILFTDARRRTRVWDGFIGPDNLSLRCDADHIARFEEAVKQHFNSRHVHVDTFERVRVGGEDKLYDLVQATVYRDGPLDARLEFVDEKLDRPVRQLAIEATLTYEPSTGVIEVIAGDRESREGLARMFAEKLLQAEFTQERVPLRRFDPSFLLKPFDFPTDPEDGISGVVVNNMRLKPIDHVGERVTLECMRDAARTIWDMVRERIGSSDSDLGGWVITQVKLTIHFHASGTSRRGNSLPLTIIMPHGCNLKDCTDRERLIGDKYLRRWGFLSEA